MQQVQVSYSQYWHAGSQISLNYDFFQYDLGGQQKPICNACHTDGLGLCLGRTCRAF